MEGTKEACSLKIEGRKFSSGSWACATKEKVLWQSDGDAAPVGEIFHETIDMLAELLKEPSEDKEMNNF